MDQALLLEQVLGLLKTLDEAIGVPGESLEDKNILQGDSPSDPNKKVKPSLSSVERKRTKEIASLFAKTFFEYKRKEKKDSSLKTSASKITRITPKAKAIPPSPSNKPGLMIAGILALLGGAGALLMGLLTDGPFQGALKILSKIGIKGGIKLLVAGAKAFLGSLSKFITAPLKMVGKLFNKGLFAKMFSFLKPLAKVLKKIPLIGNIISIGFAISRFKKGDVVGGVIDTLSALTGLLYFVPGGQILAPILSIGLDVLNAWLDFKAASPENKGKGKLDILKDMGGKVGQWIMDNALYLPIIGGFKRWGMAYDSFKSGNIMDGIKQIGLGLITFGGGGFLVKGFEMLMGFFGSKDKAEGDLSPDNSWSSRLKDWIKAKLKDLPDFIKKPLEWFGILDESGESKIKWSDVTSSVTEGYEKMKSFVGPIWDNIWNGFSEGFKWIGEKTSGIFEKMKGAFDSLTESVKPMIDNLKKIFSESFEKIIGWVKNMLPFNGDDKSPDMSDSDKEARAKKAGHASWAEYEASGWKWKSEKPPVTLNQTAPPPVPVIAPNNTNLDRMEQIGIAQLRRIKNIETITMGIFKRIDNNSGGATNTIPVNIPSPQNEKGDPMFMGSDRSSYNSSPYALA